MDIEMLKHASVMTGIVFLVHVLLTQSALAAMDCADVGDFVLPDVRIESTERVAEPVSHCKIAGVIGPEIRFELLLPDIWNGKFIMGGGGGFVGSVQNAALRYSDALQRGYVTVGTDTGHQAHGVDASWALNNLERLVNFGHVAVHRTAEMSKAIAHLYYGNPVAQSYFIGCSRGGGQALMEAQRYPQDFDGIIAGAPAYNWSGIAAQGVQIQQHMYPDPTDSSRPVVSQDNLALLKREILAACDGLDGLEDGILNDPRDCRFDLQSLAVCVEDEPGAECLTEAQRRAIQAVYEGAHDAAGNLLMAGYPYGSEGESNGWVPWIVGGAVPIAPGVPSLQVGFSNGIFKYFIHQDPDWQYMTQQFDDYADESRLAASVLNATATDLSAFKAAGGKLLMWHGWSDPALTALASAQYYEAVAAGDPEVEDYFRFFLLPGVLHCAGGPGPSLVDYLTSLEQWVEHGQAPAQLTARFASADGVAAGARPLCAYPKFAQYKGSGNDRDASNFTCEE
jgi:feruloyl esterase